MLPVVIGATYIAGFSRGEAIVLISPSTVRTKRPGGTWAPTVVDIYEVILGSEGFSGSGTISVFAQAADDARSVIDFIHEYEVPADSTENR